jgi:anti-repressor protein
MDNKEVQVYESKFGKVRVVMIDGVPWFVGKDIAECLGYTDTAHAILDHVDEEDRTNSKTQGQNDPEFGQRGTWLVNESGMYSLALFSKLPTAKPFRRWITSEVLPSIRKTGSYSVNEKPLSLEEQMAQGLIAANKLIAEKNKQIEVMKPKALFADAVSSSRTSILIRDLAKLIKQNGIDIGQNRLYEWLRDKGYLIKKGSDKNMPTQKAMNLNLFEIKVGSYINGQGANVVTRTPKVTGKGQVYFVNKFLAE